jgi:hypothetical protein
MGAIAIDLPCRLESVFSELAHGYYEECMRRVRSHRVEAAASHYILTTRHQFKLGFFAELAGLSTDALKYAGERVALSIHLHGMPEGSGSGSRHQFTPPAPPRPAGTTTSRTRRSSASTRYTSSRSRSRQSPG